MPLEIPKNPGLEELPKDARDIKYSAVFGEAKDVPQRFDRPIPVGLKVPYQKQVPSCVSCCATYINQYKSRINDGNNIEGSWRKIHADTGEYGVGRNLRSIASYLQKKGQPEAKYCPNNADLIAAEFMKADLLPEGIANALRRRVGPYTFVNDGDKNELAYAMVKEPIFSSLGGTNEDWRKPFSEIVQQTAQPKWYHSVALIDFSFTEHWWGIMNWWNDGYRRISMDYKLTGSITFEDLPDGDKTNMLKTVRASGDLDIYVIADGKRFLLPDSDTQRFYLNDLKIIEEIVMEISQEELQGYPEGEKIPSIKLMRVIEPIAKDIFLKNSD